MRNKSVRNWMWLMGLVALGVFSAAAPKMEPQKLAVIVDTENTLSSIDQKTFTKIMMGQKQRWSGYDESITLALLKTSHPIGKRMVSEIYKMRLKEYKRYWPRQIFAMKGKVPHNFTNEKELIEFVAQTPGAIGVVCDCSDLTDVKVLKVAD